jgi:hypothetical protein
MIETLTVMMNEVSKGLKKKRAEPTASTGFGNK